MALGGLEGKVFIVTGGGSGIGRATARRLIDEGAAVGAVDAAEERLRQTAEEVDDPRLHTLVGDVASAEDMERAFASTIDRFARLDGLFNNAGAVAPREPLAEIDPREYDRVFDVNVRGTFLGMRAMVAAAAQLRSPASIVNMASGLALRGAPRSGFYAASKAAIISLTQTAAIENAAAGVRVNVLVPGPVDTPLFARHPPELKAAMIEHVPLGRFGRPAELASAAVWLLSDESSFVTGSALRVDGGEAA